MNHRQPKTRALANAFRREEWLYRALERFFVHAGAGVSYAHAKIISCLQARRIGPPCRADPDRASLRHRVTSVDRQVEKRELELVGVGDHFREFGREVR